MLKISRDLHIKIFYFKLAPTKSIRTMDTNQFRKKLRSILLESDNLQNVSQLQVAAEAGIDYQHYCKLMRYGNDMKLSTLFKILKRYGITLQDLLHLIHQKVKQYDQQFKRKKRKKGKR